MVLINSFTEPMRGLFPHPEGFFLKYFILYFNYRNIKVINLQKPLNRNSCCFPTDILDFSDMACLEEVQLKAIEVNF